MVDRVLTESFELAGTFWLPDAPEVVIHGTLYFTPERTELQLHGTFRQPRGVVTVADPVVEYPAIHGTTSSGERVTLIRALRMGQSFSAGPGGASWTERLLSVRLLMGIHAFPDTVYPKVRFRVPGLHIWLSRQAIEVFVDWGTEPGTGATIRGTRLPKDLARVPTIAATIEWEITLRLNTDVFQTASMTPSAWLSIQPDQPQPLEWFLRQYRHIATLLTMLAGAPMFADMMVASTDTKGQAVSLMIAPKENRWCNFTKPYEFFMLRSGIGVDLEAAIVKWFEQYEQILMPSQLALSVLVSEKLWLHVEFLSLMQALEGFHRALIAGTYMDPNAFEEVERALVLAIPDTVGEDHRLALRQRIHHGNEISLGKRVDALTKRLSMEIRSVVLGGEGVAPRAWIDTRHYYTHWDEALRSKIIEGQEMAYANVRLREFLRVLYLDLVGITQEAISKALRDASSIAQYLLQLNAVERRKADPSDRSGAIMEVTAFSQESPRAQADPPADDVAC